MGRLLRKGKRVDYHKAVHRYDGLDFVRAKTITKVHKFTGQAGRASSAPPLTSWPLLGMHVDVDYFAGIGTDPGWRDGSADTIWLPFKLLDIHVQVWQGLSQVVAGKDADVEARAHFNNVYASLRLAYSSHRVTEAVGEAAAAIYMLEHHRDYRMIWGAHVHSGTGIDQIWRRDNLNGSYDYIIVEAKGPGAGLIQSPFLPPNYNQMELGWVVNHLYSMDRNNHAAGQDIVAKLGLRFAVAHAHYNGGSKSYHGLAGNSGHAHSPSRVFGLVVTASWRSDGRLGYVAGARTQYL